MKRCTVCKNLQEFICFYEHKYTKDGFGSLCKNCLNKKTQKDEES